MQAFVLVTLVASMLAAVASPVEAQGSAFRGLFGGAQGPQERSHVFDLTGTLFGSYLTDISEETGAEGAEKSSESSPLTGASAVLRYQRNWRNGVAGAYGTGGVSYLFAEEDGQEDPWVERWQAGVLGSFSKELSRRTRWTLAGNATYSPNYSFGIGQRIGGLTGTGGIGMGPGVVGGSTADPGAVQGVPVLPGLDYDVLDEPVIFSSGVSTLEWNLSQRASIQGYYSGSVVSFVDSATDDDDQLSHVVGARYRHVINRYVSARAGYGYRRSDYGSEPLTSHDVDVGLDGGYGRAFALGRRTTFSFDTRSSVYVYDSPSPDQTFSAETRVFVGGSAGLNHQMGRTWTSELRYDRTAGFTAGFGEPFFSDIATAYIRGFVSRKFDVVALGRYTRGEVGFGGDDNGFWSATSQVQLRTALGRHVAAHAQYFLYRYNFGNSVSLPGQLRPALNRYGVSVGLTAWVPFI